MILFASIVTDISKSIPSVEGNSFYKYLKEPINNSLYIHQITKMIYIMHCTLKY